MIKEYYICDCGSILVAYQGSSIRIFNRIGDGMHKCYLFESSQEFNEYKQEHYQYTGCANNDYYLDTILSGKWEVKFNDCNIDSETLFELNGDYEVYVNSGKVYFVKI